MRVVLIAAIILLLLAVGGYLTVYRGNDRTSVNIETHKLEQDTKQFVDKTKHEWEEAKHQGKRMLDEPHGPGPAHPANP